MTNVELWRRVIASLQPIGALEWPPTQKAIAPHEAAFLKAVDVWEAGGPLEAVHEAGNRLVTVYRAAAREWVKRGCPVA